MPEKDKDKNPKNVSDTDKDKKAKEASETEALVKKAKLVRDAPTGPGWEKITSGGKDYYVKRTKTETPPTETPVVPPRPPRPAPSKGKSTGLPQKPKKVIPPKPKDTPKEEDFTEEVVMLETPPAKQTGMFGSVSTYRRNASEASTKDYEAYEYPDATGNYTNKAIRKYAVGIDVIDPFKSYDNKGNFKPFFTGEKLPDPQLQQIKTAGFDDVVDDRGPNYKGSLMMPGTKATRIAGGGGGEFNQRNIADVPNALDKAPTGYIEQKYDSEGKPILTPNQGVQFNEENLTPLRVGEMEAGKMYDIPNTTSTIVPNQNKAKGGKIMAPKMKKYAVGGDVAGYNSQGQAVDRFGNIIENEGMSTEDVGKSALGILTDTAGKLGGSKTTTSTSNTNASVNAKSDVTNSTQSGSTESSGLMDKLGGKSAVIGGATSLGSAAAGLGASYIDSKNKDARGRYKNVESAVGSSALKGAATGAQIGSLIPGVGTLIGAGVGAVGGGIYGAIKGEEDVKAIKASEAKMASELAQANTKKNQNKALADRDAGILEGGQATQLTASEAIYNEKDELINAREGGIIGAARMRYAKGGTIVGKGGPKDDAIFTKANKEGIEPGSFIVPAENNEKAKGIRAALFGDKNKISKFKKGGEMESNVAVSNGEHLFTPKERKKIVNYLGEEILEELAPNAEENSEEMNMGGMLKRADGSYSKRGLWDNIRDAAGSGKQPTAEMLKQEKKIKAEYYNGGIIPVDVASQKRTEQIQDSYAGGGYVVEASSDREGKTHKVTGPDGTVKYFGDSNLGQHPGDPKRKEAFYARHKENLDNNPHFRAYARETWAEGGTTGDGLSKDAKMYGGAIRGYAEGTPNDGTNPKNKTTIPVGRLVRIDKDEDGKETRTEYPYSKKTKTVSALRKEVLEKRNDGSEVLKVQMPDGTWKVKMVKTFETIKKADGGKIMAPKMKGYAMGTDVEGVEDVPVSKKTYAELITPPTTWRGTKEAYKAAVDKSIKEGKTIPKGGVMPSLLTPTAEVKSEVKAAAVKGDKKGEKVPKSVRFDPKMLDESEGEGVIVPGGNLSPNEMEVLAEKERISSKNAKKLYETAWAADELNNPNAVKSTSPPAPRKGLADYVKNIDPGAAFSAYQIMQGSKLLKSGQRPEDVSKIDPAYNAAVERAQRDATFGYTPEQAAMLDQKAINALNDARFAGKNLASGSGTTAFLQERQAINQGWTNALQLKSADQQLRMQKQQYADQAVKERADFLDMQRRRAFGDAMNTYNVNQESGSALVGAGVRNAIGAFRYQKELDAQERAAKMAGAPIKTT
mgnify:CR=1 FL=1